jgi:tRNA-dihydrouridine synthase B
VMIGRGAYGRPWLPGEIASRAAGQQASNPPADVLAELIVEHYDAMIEHYGCVVGPRAARKHLGWYMENAATPDANAIGLRRAIMTETRPREVVRLVRAYFEPASERRAA